MKNVAALISIALTLVLLPMVYAAEAEMQATGIVYHDRNGDRKLDDGDKPLEGVKVSNGREIVATDAAGRYRLPVGDDTILFVIKPKGWRTPLSDDKLPRFYYIHKPNGSPELKYKGVKPTGPLPAAIDFPLYPNDEPETFRAILFGDPQPRDQKEIDYIAHDVVEELIGTDASLGVTLGDILFDDLSLFGSINSTIALIGIPWYNVIGNHDINYDAKDDAHSDESYESVYGPSYYSFDYGTVHFLVLDDIDWYFPKPDGKGAYRAGLGESQLEFIKNDLALIPADQLVVLMMHIPLTDVRDRQSLYRLIEKRPACISISGHTHTQEHVYIKQDDGWLGPQPHHHIINVTVSGSWWSGKTDEFGVPHTMMADGAPNGYSIIEFDGAKYRLDFKAARKPASHQMHITASESVKLAEIDQTTVYVNVYSGCEKTKVAMQLASSDEWIEMEKTVEIDPAFQAAWDAEKAIVGAPWRELPKPKASSHLWKAALPKLPTAGTYLIRVRATLPDGREFVDRRLIRVE